MTRYRRSPQAVVVDTGRVPAAAACDEAGEPLTLEAARQLAGQLNAARPVTTQTWRPYRLTPDLPAWLVEQHAYRPAGPARGEITAWWLVYAADPGHALIHASDAAVAAGGEPLPALGQPDPAEDGYRWTAEVPGFRFEVRKIR